MRIIFMGSPDFSRVVLASLAAAGHEIVAVYAQPPRKAGRGKKLRLGPVHQRAQELGIEVRTPLNFKNSEEIQTFEALNADVAVVVAYGLILPQSILDAPDQGCINIHASLLPRWRGAAPIHRAIMAGDSETGICIMQMDAGLDTGPVLMRETIAISEQVTTSELHDSLADMAGQLICDTLEKLNKLNAEPQSLHGVTYAHKIDKAEAKIDWSLEAKTVDRQIRGLSQFPGAWCEVAGERIKILDCVLSAGNGQAGEVLDEKLTIACGQGAVRLTRLQRAGKSQMGTSDFLRGFPSQKGDSWL